MTLAKTSLSSSIISVSVTTNVGIYTNPSSTKTYIKGFVIHNTGASNALCKLYQVAPSGGVVGTAVSTNQFFSQYINSGETTFLEYPYPLTLTDTNHSIRFTNETLGNIINIQILGDRDP